MDQPENDERNGWKPDPAPPVARTLFVVTILALMLAQFVFSIFTSVTDRNPDYFPVVVDALGLVTIVAVICFGENRVQFSLCALVIALLTLQIPVALLFTSKSKMQWGTGIVLGLIWLAGIVVYVLASSKPARRE